MMNYTEDPVTLQKVRRELEGLRSMNSTTCDGMPFPNACKRLLRSIGGNSCCVDCGTHDNDWASVTYGVLLCVRCSGRHRSYGVATSRVRSISMDNWSYSQVLAMLEGGNEQLHNFYDRHDMGNNKSRVFDRRYQTKAAKFYRKNMESHVSKIGQIGLWKGRAASREAAKTTKTNHHHHHQHNNKPTKPVADNQTATHRQVTVQ